MTIVTRASADRALIISIVRLPNNRAFTMAITETRIGLVSFTCPGCDCGTCVAESLRDIARIDGVIHVRVDRRRTQIVVRHDREHVHPDQIVRVVKAKGIPLSD